MKYSAINIGPIIGTLSMARKPRELWTASFLFSYLMKCIYAEAEQAKAVIISPAKPEKETGRVGIYPDRLFIRGEFNVRDILKSAINQFLNAIGLKQNEFDNYFNIMTATCDVAKDSLAIYELNQKLDVLELCNYAADKDATKAIYKIIAPYKKTENLLYRKATGTKFEVKTLAEYATAELEGLNSQMWEEARRQARLEEKIIDKLADELKLIDKELPEDLLYNWDDFYSKLNKCFVEECKDNISENKKQSLIRSYHKYFCVVQADGDNVGKTVSHEGLNQDDVLNISKELASFGTKSATLIEEFGGLPIYAGGDDLLFISPVIGKDRSNIFDLLDKIEKDAFKGVHDVVGTLGIKDDDGKLIEASLSFGVSISYYKYPLYEALEAARTLLFNVAKNKERFPDKKAVAWSLRKHSGGTFDAAFSLKDEKLKEQFKTLITATTDNDTVSAIAHKLRQEEALVDVVLASRNQDRLDALFDKVLEFDKDKADYFNAVKTIMPTLYEVVGKDGYIQTLYSLLRTAKFIKGEDLHDE